MSIKEASRAKGARAKCREGTGGWMESEWAEARARVSAGHRTKPGASSDFLFISVCIFPLSGSVLRAHSHRSPELVRTESHQVYHHHHHDVWMIIHVKRCTLSILRDDLHE